ncbi:hypothetical protein [Sphingobium yanoikuyae]|uniref:hypothetical protein n=2 Tax=Sphingobium yanoikuyae TaxID=13690 RepID=UPI0008468447|nr:hypothetical protein [Sphingobium yanoikuyae]
MNQARRMLTGCGLVLGAAGFFLLGIGVSQRAAHRQEAAPSAMSSGAPASPPSGRRIFSPSIVGDPYVLQQWKEAVEKMERRCREAKLFCAEAKAAREQMDEIR